MKFLKHVAFAAAMGCVSISAFAVGHYSPDQGYAYDVVRHGVMISEKMLPNEDGRTNRHQSAQLVKERPRQVPHVLLTSHWLLYPHGLCR